MKVLALVVTLLAASAAAVAQQDALRTARDLYASAAYEEALSELTRVEGRAPAAAAAEMDAYRTFCLVALGRTAEAEAVAETLLRQDPMVTIDTYPDASPRLVAIFAAVRKRVLPQVIRAEYRTARALTDAKAPDAEPQLARVRQMLDHAEKTGAWDDTLADLRILVEGFLQLARASRPPDAASLSASVAEPHAGDAAASSPSAAAEYRFGSAGVVPPVVVSQTLPSVPGPLLDLVRRLRGSETIDILIDERGSVEKVTVTQSVNTAYDTLIVGAARGWKYRPATKDGRPVRFVKTVVIEANAQ